MVNSSAMGIVDQILVFMGRHGLRYYRGDLKQIRDYVENMVKDKRVIAISENGDMKMVIFFSITNDYEKFYKKGTWTYLRHDPNGRELYIEKAVAPRWNRGLRKEIERILIDLYPNLQICRWHRWGKYGDRPVKTYRRVLSREASAL